MEFIYFQPCLKHCWHERFGPSWYVQTPGYTAVQCCHCREVAIVPLVKLLQSQQRETERLHA